MLKTRTKVSVERSRIMRAVKSSDTQPELKVRRTVFGMGYRYRLHRKDLPGKPDIVFVARQKVIFVHGCFWHGHNCSRGARVPKRNKSYWTYKIGRNKQRDKSSQLRLKKAGWDYLVLWECELKDDLLLRRRLKSFLRNRT